MKRWLLIGSPLVFLGCLSPEQQAQKDEATCLSMGARPGTDMMVQCRMQQQQVHFAEEARRRQAIGALGDSLQAEQNRRDRASEASLAAMANRQSNCRTVFTGNVANTSCY